MLPIHVCDLPLHYKLWRARPVLWSSCYCSIEVGGSEVGGGKEEKEGRELSNILQFRSTFTSCSPHFDFPLEGTEITPRKRLSLEHASLPAIWPSVCWRSPAQHKGHQPPRQHCKGRNQSGGNQRFRVILQVIFSSQGTLLWTLHPTGEGSPQRPPSHLSSLSGLLSLPSPRLTLAYPTFSPKTPVSWFSHCLQILPYQWHLPWPPALQCPWRLPWSSGPHRPHHPWIALALWAGPVNTVYNEPNVSEHFPQQRAKHISAFKHVMKQINIVIGFWELLLSLSFPWSTCFSTPSPNKSLSLSPLMGLELCWVSLVFPGILLEMCLDHPPNSSLKLRLSVWHLSELASLLDCCTFLVGASLFQLDNQLHGFFCMSLSFKVAFKWGRGSRVTLLTYTEFTANWLY